MTDPIKTLAERMAVDALRTGTQLPVAAAVALASPEVQAWVAAALVALAAEHEGAERGVLKPPLPSGWWN